MQFTDAQKHRRVHLFVHEGTTYEVSIFTTGPVDWYMTLVRETSPGVYEADVSDKIQPDYSVNDASRFMETDVNGFLSGSGGGGGPGWEDVAAYLGDRIAEYYYDAVTKQFVRS